MKIHTSEGLTPMSEKEMIEKFGVDHINNQLFGVLHHKKDGKIAQFWEKI